MGLSFGSLTKVDFKIAPENKNALNIQTQYNDQWNVFEEAKKAEDNAKNGGGTATASMNIDELTSAREDAESKLLSLQTTLAEEAAGKPGKNQTSPDDKEKNKVPGAQLGKMMA